MQTISMNHVDPDLSLDYISTFLQFQDKTTGQMCSVISPGVYYTPYALLLV